MLKRYLVLTLPFLTCTCLIAQQPKCEYFGLSTPKEIPLDFNPKAIDLEGRFKFNVELSNCNELYFTTITSSENIFMTKKINDKWTPPQIASFSDPNYNDADPFISSDGRHLYFISKRPTNNSDKRLDFNIWYAERDGNGWTQAKPLPKPINSDEADEYMFSVSDKGNAFFSSNRKGGNGSFDIYTARVSEDHTFSEPKNLGSPISTEGYEFDPYISPDEQFMLFSINKNGNSDLYYSYKDDQGHWTTPQSLGDRINITGQDFAPSLSPDGEFIFFSNNGKLRWISATIIKVTK